MLSSTANKVQYAITYPFATTYDITFKFWLAAEIHAILSFPAATGKADQELVLNTDFSLSAPGDTGVLTRITDWDHGANRLTIYRMLDLDQLSDYVNGQAVDMDVLEQDFDRATARMQQIAEPIQRILQAPITDAVPLSKLPAAAERAGHFLGFDVDGDTIVGDPAGAPVTSWAQTLLDDTTLLAGQKTLGLIPSGASAVISAFIQGLLDDADAAGAIRTMQLQRWTSAQLVGSGLTITAAGRPSLAALNGTDVAFIDDINTSLRTYRFDGSTWALVGSGLSLPGIGYGALAALNSTDVAFIDSNGDALRCYRFNGSTWSLVGSPLYLGGVLVPALAALNGTDVAFIDSGNMSLRTYRFNGSTWALVGSGLTISGLGYVALTALNGTDVAFIDSGNMSLRTYRFDGSTWAQVGSGLAIATISDPSLAALNSTDVAFIDKTNKLLRTYRFNGSTWAQVGSQLAISVADSATLAALNGTDVAFIEMTGDLLRTYRFGFALEAPYHP